MIEDKAFLTTYIELFPSYKTLNIVLMHCVVNSRPKKGLNVHKLRSNWSQAAVVVVTLSENGVRTTLWGGVCPIYSSWGACQSVTSVEQN